MRPLTDGDLDDALALLREDEEELTGRPSRLEPSDLREWLSQSDFPRDTWAIDDEHGLAAFGWLMPSSSGPVPCVGIVRPRAKGRGYGGAIVRQAEARARELGAARIHQIALGTDAAAGALLRALGYREVRRFYDMAIELAAPPAVPAEVAIETMRDGDEREFHDALEEAFQDHWEPSPRPFEEWWEDHRQREGFDPTLWFFVRDGDRIVAVARNAANRNGGGYIGAIGVRRDWRGRGLARALLLHTFAEFHRRGLPRVTLGVDAESPTGATRLYESVGMEVEMENVVYEKALV